MSLRDCWNNCQSLDFDIATDPEIQAIDRMEDALSSLSPNVIKIRELISRLEMCHHKAERWVQNIIEAIGSGQTSKGLGTRPTGQRHSAEQTWQTICSALVAWRAECPAESVDLTCETIPLPQLLATLGQRSPLKEWQVQRVIERIRSFINWPQSENDPSTRYVGILECGGDYESKQHGECPLRFKECNDFWLATVQATVPGSLDWKKEKLSLALAIDLLMACHWNFLENLEIVLQTIGGEIPPSKPFIICGFDPTSNPLRSRMRIVSNTLKSFCGDSQPEEEIDRALLSLLGEPSEIKKWLAASLDKTIRLQLQI